MLNVGDKVYLRGEGAAKVAAVTPRANRNIIRVITQSGRTVVCWDDSNEISFSNPFGSIVW